MHKQYGFTLIIVGHMMHIHFSCKFPCIVLQNRNIATVSKVTVSYNKKQIRCGKNKYFLTSVIALPATLALYNVHAA